jgi:hypothetical protein
MGYAGGISQPPVQKLVATLISFRFGGRKCKSNPSSVYMCPGIRRGRAGGESLILFLLQRTIDSQAWQGKDRLNKQYLNKLLTKSFYGGIMSISQATNKRRKIL